MFANPIFLWGVLAVSVPVVIHLIFRRKRLAVDYPTLMFVRRVDMKLASRRKVKELLLLALRTLAILMVVLALARPGFHAKGKGGASADCVIILDNSATMGLAVGAGTRLEMARSQAAAIIAAMGEEGRAAILTTVTGDDGAEVGTFSVDRERLAHALQAIQPANSAGSLTGALLRTKEIFAQSASGLNRELYVLSDFQANSFRDPQALKDATSGLPSNLVTFFCPVQAAMPDNHVSLVRLSMDPRPKVAGRVMRLVATVKNNSLREIATTLTATMRDIKPITATVTLVAGATQDVPLVLTLGHEGFTWGEVKVDNDDTPFDNVWPFSLEVRGPIRALVVTPALPKKAEQSEAFYLVKALDPTGDGRLSGIRVEHVAMQAFPKELDPYDAVVLCGGPSLAQEPLQKLRSYLERGGGLMIFAAPRDVTLASNHPLQGFLGGKITGELAAKGTQKPYQLQTVRPASLFFDDCRTTEGVVEFTEVSVVHALKVEPGPETEVLAQFSGGHPAILAHKQKKGQVLWWTLSAHTDDSNLPLVPQFLSLLHRSVSVFAHAQEPSISQQAGNALILDLSARRQKDAKAEYPAAVTIYDATEKSYEVPVTGGRVTWRQTGRAGVYRMAAKVAEEKGAEKKAAAAAMVPVPPGFVLTPDPDESAPEYKSPDEARRLLALESGAVVDAGADLKATVDLTRQGRELFGYFIFAGLLAILAEVLLANMIGVRMKTAPIIQAVPVRRTEEQYGSLLGSPATATAEAPPAPVEAEAKR
jgi:hypothetical protein